MKISRSKICISEENPWVTIRDNKTKPRNNKESAKYQLQERSQPVLLNSKQRAEHSHRWRLHNKKCSGIKLAKAAGHRVVVKPFPEATIRDMRSHVFPTIESPDQICLHVGTIDLKSSTSSEVADAIIDQANTHRLLETQRFNYWAQTSPRNTFNFGRGVYIFKQYS